jgi:3-(3-hydroxy-phenyl)propionate hydroxylase
MDTAAAANLADGSLTGPQIQALEFDYRRAPDHDLASPARHPVAVVGAGPVGLTLAIDLAQRGHPVLLLDDDHRLSSGSRAICFAKRTLEVWDRLGVGDACVDKGVSWSVGRVFLGEQQVYQFDMLPEDGHERPAFVNLQQYYVEAHLLRRATELPNIQIRWKNSVAALQGLDAGEGGGVLLGIDTLDGRYALLADYVIGCDGSKSSVRRLLGLKSDGRSFRDRFLIVDVKMSVDFPAERWFWFDPPFHRNHSVLLHRQPDNVWRIDFQLGWDADPDEERRPERITPRVNAMLRQALGREVPFELEWASVYTFSCLRMERFRHGRVLFAGDSAHGVSPFGARGANSGVQDAENLAWKLDAVLRGTAGDALLDSYASEREYAADENILHSTRATDFITPKSEISKLFRNSVLQLAAEHAFARHLVNSGRLSVPATLDGSALNTADRDAFGGAMRPGAPIADVPLQQAGRPTWLLRQTGGGFVLLVFDRALPPLPGELPAPLKILLIVPQLVPRQEALPIATGTTLLLHDHLGLFESRFDAQPGNAWLLRPDQHICARWRTATPIDVSRAMDKALARQAPCNP